MTDMVTEVKSISDLARGMDGKISGFANDLEQVKSAIAEMQIKGAYAGGATPRQVAPEIKSMIDYMSGAISAPQVKAATAAGTEAILNPVNGGYMAVTEYSNRVVEMMTDADPLLGEVDMMTIGANVLGLPVEKGRPEVKFLGELDATETSTVKLGMVNIPIKQASTAVPLSRVLIQSSNLVDIESYTAGAVSKAFADKMGEVIINGDGVNQPAGILNAKGLKSMKTGASKSVSIDALMDVVGALPEKADANAKWFMKKSTFFKIAGVFGKESNYISMGLGGDMGKTLFGYPVVFCKSMPDVTADGNVCALFGDMRSYKAVQAGGLEYLRDPYTDSAQGVVNMRYWTGLGGALVQTDGIISVKVGA